jgi:hypothetical protein
MDSTKGDDNVTVSWQRADPATTYTLQEAPGATFSNGRVVCEGTRLLQRTPAPEETPNRYWNCVKASSSWGDSRWSNVRSVVLHPLLVGPDPRWDGWTVCEGTGTVTSAGTRSGGLSRWLIRMSSRYAPTNGTPVRQPSVGAGNVREPPARQTSWRAVCPVGEVPELVVAIGVGHVGSTAHSWRTIPPGGSTGQLGGGVSPSSTIPPPSTSSHL